MPRRARAVLFAGAGLCWLAANVAFATTMVDRITPGISEADRAAVTQNLRGQGVPVNDPAGEHWQELASGSAEQGVERVLGELMPELDADTQLRHAVLKHLVQLTA